MHQAVLLKPLFNQGLDIDIGAEADNVGLCSHDFIGAVEDDLLILLLVQGDRVVHFAAFLDENLVDLELDGLSLDDPLFDGIFTDKAIDVDILGLANSVRAVHRLKVYLGVEVGVVEHHVVR